MSGMEVSPTPQPSGDGEGDGEGRASWRFAVVAWCVDGLYWWAEITGRRVVVGVAGTLICRGVGGLALGVVFVMVSRAGRFSGRVSHELDSSDLILELDVVLMEVGFGLMRSRSGWERGQGGLEEGHGGLMEFGRVLMEGHDGWMRGANGWKERWRALKECPGGFGERGGARKGATQVPMPAGGARERGVEPFERGNGGFKEDRPERLRDRGRLMPAPESWKAKLVRIQDSRPRRMEAIWIREEASRAAGAACVVSPIPRYGFGHRSSTLPAAFGRRARSAGLGRSTAAMNGGALRSMKRSIRALVRRKFSASSVVVAFPTRTRRDNPAALTAACSLGL